MYYSLTRNRKLEISGNHYVLYGTNMIHNFMTHSSGAFLKLQEVGLCCRKHIDYASGHAHFWIYGNNLPATVVYMKD